MSEISGIPTVGFSTGAALGTSLGSRHSQQSHAYAGRAFRLSSYDTHFHSYDKQYQFVAGESLDAHCTHHIFRSSSSRCNTVLGQLEVDEGGGGGRGNGNCFIALVCQMAKNTIRLCPRNLIDSSPYT